jgi:arylsulfatase A
MLFPRRFLVPLMCLAACCGRIWIHAGVMTTETAVRPNIVFILADDLSGRDLGIYGSANHQTPHLDRFAREGMRFTQAYSPAPICSASRSAFLTGRSPARLQFEFVTKLPGTEVAGNRILQIPPYPLDLPLSETTLGEMLGGAGYRTGFYGKWHVSAHNGGYLNWSATHGPLQQGFEEGEQEFGSHPYGDAERGPADRAALPEGDFGDDALTEKAVAFLRRHRQEPFFLYLSHYYVHDPIRSRAEWSKKDNQRELPPGTNPDRATYAAMVENLDELVGRVLRELDELGLTENTLVVFTSDNGGHPRYAANGPSRGSKWNLYEGGVRVPFMVRWPGSVAPGTECAVPIVGTDLFPTLAAVANVPLDPRKPLDGMSLLPLWETGHSMVDRPIPLVWHFPFYHPEKGFDQARTEIGINDFEVSQTYPQSAIRVGDFKLLHFYEDNRDELYDLGTDPSERHDLTQLQPDRTRALRQALFTYLKQVGARFPSRK